MVPVPLFSSPYISASPVRLWLSVSGPRLVGTDGIKVRMYSMCSRCRYWLVQANAARAWNASHGVAHQPLRPVPCTVVGHANFGRVPANVPGTADELELMDEEQVGAILVEYGEDAGPAKTRKERIANILGVRNA